MCYKMRLVVLPLRKLLTLLWFVFTLLVVPSELITLLSFLVPYICV